MLQRALTLLLTLTKKLRQQRIRTRIALLRAVFLATCPETKANQRQTRKIQNMPQGQAHPRLTSRQNVKTSERWEVMMGTSDSSSSSRASMASQAFACQRNRQTSHRFTTVFYSEPGWRWSCAPSHRAPAQMSSPRLQG